MLASGKHRPKEISPWVKGARAVEPSIRNPAAFAQQWWLWYTELQPAARRLPDGTLQRIPLEGQDWTELRKGTINGIYSLLASLGWWLKAATANGDCKAEISRALADVDWVLDSVVRSHSSKRMSAETDSRPSKKSRNN